jgi:hypothetical protein
VRCLVFGGEGGQVRDAREVEDDDDEASYGEKPSSLPSHHFQGRKKLSYGRGSYTVTTQERRRRRRRRKKKKEEHKKAMEQRAHEKKIVQMMFLPIC